MRDALRFAMVLLIFLLIFVTALKVMEVVNICEG